jgi:hypothetical protein
MLHQVKVLDPKGKIVKIISRQKLSERHWTERFNHPKNDRENKISKENSKRLKTG